MKRATKELALTCKVYNQSRDFDTRQVRFTEVKIYLKWECIRVRWIFFVLSLMDCCQVWSRLFRSSEGRVVAVLLLVVDDDDDDIDDLPDEARK